MTIPDASRNLNYMKNIAPVVLMGQVLDEITLPPLLQRMTIAALADVTRRDWKKVYFGAVPYLEAMRSLTSVQDNYGMDTGRSVVTYFLCNAQTWHGPIAKAVKKELNARIKS